MVRKSFVLLVACTLGGIWDRPALGQEQSVRPGINDPFKNPDIRRYETTFEGESREVFAQRKAITAALELKPGMAVADVGAGTGLYTRLFAVEVGAKGKVFAVDISEKFLEHIAKVNKELKLTNVETVLCKPDSVELKPESVDLVFICDTYHHFEFPYRTMASIHKALKPGGKLVLIDFKRIKGQSTEWIMSHVRAGQEVFEEEITESGFKKIKEVQGLTKENYLVIFQKQPAWQYPIIKGFGGVLPVPGADDLPQKGAKILFDITTGSKDAGQPVPSLERLAVILNLAGLAGLKAQDVQLVAVLHGDATVAALNDAEYERVVGRKHDSAQLIEALAAAGVKIEVCGQSLAKKGYDPKQVRGNVKVAASAATSCLKYQSQGYGFLPEARK